MTFVEGLSTVEDVIAAYLIAAEFILSGREKGYGHYAVTSGNFLRLKDIVSLFEKAAGRKLDIQFSKRPYRNREVMNPWHGQPVIPGWCPEVTLASGFAGLIAKEYLA